MNISDQIRFLIGIDLILLCDPNVLYVYMAVTKVVSDTFKYLSCTLDLTHLYHGDIMDFLSVFVIFMFLLLMEAQQESFSLPAPSIKKVSTATSVSRPVFISTPSSAANKTYLVESAWPRLVGESGVELTRTSDQEWQENVRVSRQSFIKLCELMKNISPEEVTNCSVSNESCHGAIQVGQRCRI